MNSLTGNTGIRSKELGRKIKTALQSGVPLEKLLEPDTPDPTTDKVITDDQATEWAWEICSKFVDKRDGTRSNLDRDSLKSEQIVFYSRAEINAMERLIKNIREKKAPPSAEELKTVMAKNAGKATDLALFGRMLASSPDFSVEAACQVAHAITVHRVAIEDDFFTAVDDLNRREEDAGSAHMGDQGFAAGLFYLYICIDCDLLKENLDGDAILTNAAIQALTKAAATVAPTGKQNSFGSKAWASYILAEKGSRQPRSLSAAFLKPVREGDMLSDSISSLEITRDNLDKVYFKRQAIPSERINAVTGEGDMETLLNFVTC